ncbi:hypothetical protein CCP2SC5_250034 [Azospirillaceae bacterium]
MEVWVFMKIHIFFQLWGVLEVVPVVNHLYVIT